MAARLNFIRWIGLRAIAAALVLGLMLAAGGLWLFLQDHGDFEAVRREHLQAIENQRAKVQAALTEVPRRMAQITADIAAEQERIRRTAGVIAQLKALDRTWDRLTGDPQQQANSERRAKLEQQQADSMVRLAALQTDFTRTGWERDGQEIELDRLERQRKAAESWSMVGHYLSRAWSYEIGWLKVKGWAGVLLSLALFALTVRGIAVMRPAGGTPGAKR